MAKLNYLISITLKHLLMTIKFTIAHDKINAINKIVPESVKKT